MRVSMCSLPISRSASNTSPLIIQSAGDPFELSVLSEARERIVDMTTASKVDEVFLCADVTPTSSVKSA